MDLIDRDELRMIIFTTGRSNGKTAFAEAISKIINGAPPVDAMPVIHGKWIQDEFGSKCGSCGLYAYRDKFDQPWESPYCPNCGAKMDEEEKEKAFWPRYLLKPCASEREDKMKDCRDCVQWETCQCGKTGHERGTSIGYSIGECKDYMERKSK